MKKSALKWTAALGAVVLSASVARAADYPTMAPLDQYMMDRTAEIALAKSAAPAAISDKATVMVLARHGYETAIKGTNGFVCAVERAWMSEYEFPQFWNPHMRGPLCFNPTAARSVLPYTIKRTELVLAGRTKTELNAAIKDSIAKHTLPPFEAGALTYMMSKQQYLNDKAHAWMPHLMFYFPKGEAANWGADLPGAPLILNPQFQKSAEPMSVVLVAVSHWSDGTSAPTHGY